MGLIPGLAPNLEPAQKRMALSSNYLSFTEGDNDFAQQYLPELYEQEVERYGNRTISGFLRMVGAEMPMTSDQVVWSEQNRLHVSYETAEVVDGSTIRITIDPDVTASGGVVGSKQCAIKINQTLVVYGNGTTGAGVGESMKTAIFCEDLIQSIMMCVSGFGPRYSFESEFGSAYLGILFHRA